MQYNAMQYHAVQYHAMQSKTIQYMQYIDIPCNTLLKSFETKLDGSIWAVTVLDEQGVPL